jgi:hypothetical protein
MKLFDVEKENTIDGLKLEVSILQSELTKQKENSSAEMNKLRSRLSDQMQKLVDREGKVELVWFNYSLAMFWGILMGHQMSAKESKRERIDLSVAVQYSTN